MVSHNPAEDSRQLDRRFRRGKYPVGMPRVNRPLDEALLLTSWTARFDPFDADERRRLESFNDLLWDTVNWPLFQKRVSLNLGREERLDYAGVAELRAAADDFRQLWLDSEPTSHRKTLDLLGVHIAPEHARSTRAMLGGISDRYQSAARETLMFVGVPRGRVAIEKGMPGGPVGMPVRARAVVDDWMHGMKAHRDPEKRRRVQMWSPTSYTFTLIKAMHGYLDAMLLTHIVVRSALGRLDEDRRKVALAAPPII